MIWKLFSLTFRVFYKKFLNQLKSGEISHTENFIAIAWANIEIAIRSRKETTTAIEFFNDDIPLKTFCKMGVRPENINATTLDGAAKDVYDFLEKNGFNPTIGFVRDKDANHSFKIRVVTPLAY